SANCAAGSNTGGGAPHLSSVGVVAVMVVDAVMPPVAGGVVGAVPVCATASPTAAIKSAAVVHKRTFRIFVTSLVQAPAREHTTEWLQSSRVGFAAADRAAAAIPGIP